MIPAGENMITDIPTPLSATPQVFSRKVNPNERVNSVDFGQTTANLGHHLETITNKP
jgi:hypothetical protein